MLKGKDSHWVGRSVSQWYGQSASGLDQLCGGQGEEESRFDVFVIGLQGVINRPELKQHLTEHNMQNAKYRVNLKMQDIWVWVYIYALLSFH